MCISNRVISHSVEYKLTINIFNNNKIYLTMKLNFHDILFIILFNGSAECLCMDIHHKTEFYNGQECK